MLNHRNFTFSYLSCIGETFCWKYLMIAVGYKLSDSLVSSPASLQQVHAARPSRSIGRKPGMTESCRAENKEAARVGRSSGSACKMVINMLG
jgi:hypothetical protein